MPEQPSRTEPARKRPPRLVLVSTIASVFIAGLLAAAFFLVGPLMHDRIVEEARKRGVEIAFNGVHFWWWSAAIEGARFRLIGVPGIEGQARTIDVSLSSFEPTQIAASGVTVDVQGSAMDLAFGLGEWTKNHPDAYRLPVTASEVSVSWSEAVTDPPWLVVEGGALTHSASGVAFNARKATLSGIDVGTVGATWSTEGAQVKLGFGTADPGAAPLTASIMTAAVPPTAHVTLSPTNLEKLGAPLGVHIPVSGVVASGTADLVFARGLDAGPINGRVAARLDGFVPPHPVELDGFLFGSTTVFSSDLAVSADRTSIDLKRTRVQAGAFELAGGGHIARSGGQVVANRGGRQPAHPGGPGVYWARIGLDLAGNLPCAAIAQSAATAHTDTFLGQLVGSAARHTIDGSVSVRVKIDADSRDLRTARVDRTIGVGCGLGPLKDAGEKFLGTLPRRVLDLANALPLPLPEEP